MDDAFPPFRPGISAKSEKPVQGKAPVSSAKISQAASLADLSEEYRFYTPAVMYTRLRLGGKDPLLDFIQETGRDVIPVCLQFDRPVFSGLEIGSDVSWNHVILAVSPDDYAALIPWLTSLIFVDRERQEVVRVRYKDLQIDDPIWRSKNPAAEGPPPQVTITAFGLDTNRGCYWLSRQEGGGIPRLRHTQSVFEDTRRLAQGVLGGSDNPLLEQETEDAVLRELEQRHSLEGGDEK